jgi:hypothetical protein
MTVMVGMALQLKNKLKGEIEMTKTKFEIYKTESGETRVRFPECVGKHGEMDYCTNIDKKGHIYFSIPYPYEREEGEKCIDKFFFYGGDSAGYAVKSVFDGYADALQQKATMFGISTDSLEPVLFADRKYGESIRKKTMDGWKNAIWKYGIRFQDLNSFGLGPVISEGMKTDGDKILFCTRKEAIQERDKLQSHIDEIIKQYQKLKIGEKHIEEKSIVRKFLDKLQKEDKLYELIIKALIATEGKDAPEPKKNYALDICQVILK